jgi:hypothetical protein
MAASGHRPGSAARTITAPRRIIGLDEQHPGVEDADDDFQRRSERDPVQAGVGSGDQDDRADDGRQRRQLREHDPTAELRRRARLRPFAGVTMSRLTRTKAMSAANPERIPVVRSETSGTRTANPTMTGEVVVVVRPA